MLDTKYDTNSDSIEVGLDEAGRGCLAGPIFAAAVIWDKNKPFPAINDSKKLTKKKRQELRTVIEAEAIDYCVAYIDNNDIDETHIGIANMKAMHEAIEGLETPFDMLLVDGVNFKKYEDKPHVCITKGDSKLVSIASASVLAKTYHDDYIEQLCHQHPQLNDYDWMNNMCYGSAKHMKAIKEHGITKYHRQSYSPCANMPMRDDI